jgi:hypothetical protein
MAPEVVCPSISGERRVSLKASSLGCIFDVFVHFSKLHLSFNYREDFIQGFEVPVLVLFCSSVAGPHNENVFSRCKSKLIVICNDKQAYKIAEQSDKGAKAIEILGKLTLNDTTVIVVILTTIWQ